MAERIAKLSEMVRVEKMNDDDRELVNLLTPEERRGALVEAGKVKVKRLAERAG